MASVQFQDILYRKCLPEDIDLIMELNDSLRPGLVTYDATYRFLTAPDHWLYAAIYQGRILGLLYGYALSRLDRPQAMLYIHELAVVPAFQRQGIGTGLLTALKAECRRRHILKFFLYTSDTNQGANALYRKLGGTVSAESQGHDTVYYFSTDQAEPPFHWD